MTLVREDFVIIGPVCLSAVLVNYCPCDFNSERYINTLVVGEGVLLQDRNTFDLSIK